MIENIVHFVTTFLIGVYVITTLQWYNYKIDRVLFHFHNYTWHILYFLFPVVVYTFFPSYFNYFFLIYIVLFFTWYKKSKGVKFTKRVKRFLVILVILEIGNLFIMEKFNNNQGLSLLSVISTAIIISYLIESLFFRKFKQKAKTKLNKISPTIITITGSYGKTSIKNFTYQLLKDNFKTYKTPRSVNTLKGIVLDINTSLPEDIQIYITEAGARERGDIKEIVEFLENEYSILGKIGPQHIEYFKTMENIKKTKLEIFKSPKLKKGFSYQIGWGDKVEVIKDKIKNIKSSLDGIEWDLIINNKIYHLKAPNILGEFNAINISLAVYQAVEFMNLDEVLEKVEKLEPIEHRLQKIKANGKIIIDDSFNGNIEGMLKSFKLIKTYNGKKIIITPGLIEATDEMNKKIAKAINETFDLAIITSQVNKGILCKNITIDKICLSNKSKLTKVLKEVTKEGDLILFSNDAPEYL
ncbi:MAG: UDP-N-acetylmuramoyl-tripeptide--D-alanyl-D-alanine ligase [Nautiliaceae bacterium]